MSQNRADFRLSVGGADMRGDIFSLVAQLIDITATVRPRLLSLSLTEKRGGEADQLEIELDDADGKLALPAKGAPIQLALGWAQGADVASGLVDKGRFVVDEVEWSSGPDRVRITARSADLRGRARTPRERSHRNTTLGAIARRVAADNGLNAAVAPELDGIAVAALSQHQVSDMALLRRLGRDHDAVATVKDGRLLLMPIGGGVTVVGRRLPGLTIRRGDGSGARYREIDRAAEGGVEARYHDQDAGERRTVSVGGGTAGGGSGKKHRLRRVYHSEAEARHAAQAAHNRARRAAAEFDFILALGRPNLYPERPVTLAGFKPPIDAKRWLVAELTHTLDARGGMTTTVKLETRAA